MPKLKPFFLRSTTSVSLNERFSQVQSDQWTQPDTLTLDPTVLQERDGDDALQLFLLLKRELTRPLQSQVSTLKMSRCVRKRRSVWTRLGWRSTPHKHGGFWSFRNKYKPKAWLTSTCRSREGFGRLQGKSRFRMKRNVQKRTPGQTQHGAHLQRGGASALRKPGRNAHGDAPTKKQLDAELDQYMSRSKRRLDQQLDEYMSKSKSRLDQQLDEYMSMAGQRDLRWDPGSGDNDLTWYLGCGRGMI